LRLLSVRHPAPGAQDMLARSRRQLAPAGGTESSKRRHRSPVADITAALLTVLPTGAPPHGDVVVVPIGGQGSGHAAALRLLLDRLLTTPQTVIANPYLDREGDGR